MNKKYLEILKNRYKVILYCQIGRTLDLAEFSINSAIENAGIEFDKDFQIIFVCWKTEHHVYEWLDKNNYAYFDMEYDEGMGFLWNLYKGWNIGYELGYKISDFVCPIATDHAFAPNWLINLLKNGKQNRIVNCKLIEPGTLPTLHSAVNLGLTTKDEFNYKKWEQVYSYYLKHYENKIVFDDCIPNERGGAYGHRLDAMPFLCHKDVWEKIGPMAQVLLQNNLTGDTDFFNRAKMSGVEIVKALDAISYHCGGVETQLNKKKNIYT